MKSFAKCVVLFRKQNPESKTFIDLEFSISLHW